MLQLVQIGVLCLFCVGIVFIKNQQLLYVFSICKSVKSGFRFEENIAHTVE